VPRTIRKGFGDVVHLLLTQVVNGDSLDEGMAAWSRMQPTSPPSTRQWIVCDTALGAGAQFSDRDPIPSMRGVMEVIFVIAGLC
jgi:hypothetical protein